MLTALLAATLLDATYISERCGFAFEYPASWTTLENPEAQVYEPGRYPEMAACAVGLKPPRWDGDGFPLRVVKWDKPFERAARDSWFSETSDGSWQVFSVIGHGPATSFKTRCCRGLRGLSVMNGPLTEQGRSLTYWWEPVLLGDRKGNPLMIESDEYHDFAPVVAQILRTARIDLPKVRRTLPADHACAGQSPRRTP